MTTSLKTLISDTVLVLVSASSLSALAQTATAPDTPASGARTPSKSMKALDTNNDKMISREEAKSRPHLTKNFDAIDTNKDGQLTRAETKAYRQAHKGEHRGEGKGPTKN
jgi:hypothetical protein